MAHGNNESFPPLPAKPSLAPCLVRASVHQKIHEQDAVFGKVFDSELMIPRIRLDSQFYFDLNDWWIGIMFLFFCWFPHFRLRDEREDIKRLTSWLKYRHELFTRHSSRLGPAGENWMLTSPWPGPGWACAVLGVQRGAVTSGGKEKGYEWWLMITGRIIFACQLGAWDLAAPGRSYSLRFTHLNICMSRYEPKSLKNSSTFSKLRNLFKTTA